MTFDFRTDFWVNDFRTPRTRRTPRPRCSWVWALAWLSSKALKYRRCWHLAALVTSPATKLWSVRPVTCIDLSSRFIDDSSIFCLYHFISIYLSYKMGTELLWVLVNLSCRDVVFVNCVSACLMHSVASLIEFDYCESKKLYMFLFISYNHAIHLRFSCAYFRSLPRSWHFWLPNAAGSDMRQHLMWFDVLCSIVPCWSLQHLWQGLNGMSGASLSCNSYKPANQSSCRAVIESPIELRRQPKLLC